MAVVLTKCLVDARDQRRRKGRLPRNDSRTTEKLKQFLLTAEVRENSFSEGTADGVMAAEHHAGCHSWGKRRYYSHRLPEIGQKRKSVKSCQGWFLLWLRIDLSVLLLAVKGHAVGVTARGMFSLEHFEPFSTDRAWFKPHGLLEDRSRPRLSLLWPLRSNAWWWRTTSCRTRSSNHSPSAGKWQSLSFHSPADRAHFPSSPPRGRTCHCFHPNCRHLPVLTFPPARCRLILILDLAFRDHQARWLDNGVCFSKIWLRRCAARRISHPKHAGNSSWIGFVCP